MLLTPLPNGDMSMATRGTIFYEFSTSAKYSVFSSETHLTWRCYLSRPNSQEWWNLRHAKIRISISLDTPLSWHNADSPIGTTLTLTRNNNINQWCDICKLRHGQYKDKQSGRTLWSLKAMTPAVWRCESESPTRKGIVRFYCQDCADDVQNWPDGTFYSLKEQLLDAVTKFADREKINVQLP